ncbi:uncharacterized protein [Dermacentor albipictus]|uniref:uncharacterized protein n=1 Tax=Dermacentor albipictus TaxID=60249 RepID=UPI0038FD383D
MGVVRRLLLLKKKLLLLKLSDLEKKRKRQICVHPVWQQRRKQGEYHTAFQDMRKDPPMFFKYYRMLPDKFDFLHQLVKNDLVKQFLCREPLCPEERLAITIRYLSSGMAIKQVAMVFRVAPATCRCQDLRAGRKWQKALQSAGIFQTALEPSMANTYK